MNQIQGMSYSLFILTVIFLFSVDFIFITYSQDMNKEDFSYQKQILENLKENSKFTQENCIDNGNEVEYSLPSVDQVNSDSYISDFHSVRKFDKNGNLLDSWGSIGSKDGEFLHAHGITIDSKDNIFVSDAEKCNIQKFDSRGNFISKFGIKGKGPGEFLKPESMAVDSLDNIYVADFSGRNIHKLDNNGQFITMFGKKGIDFEGEFKKPWGVALDSKDNIYVSDQAIPKIQKFDNNGKLLQTWGEEGNEKGQFVHLHDITVDNQDKIYVTDGRENSRVSVFDNTGNFIKQW
ncbi:MAG: 6-bladed beta-propeller [Nitrososphaeraceae archaeon]